MEFYAKDMGCGITVLCNHVGVDLKLIDMGVKDLASHSAIDARFRLMPEGTGNFAQGLAMPEEIALRAIEAGIELAGEAKRDGYQILGSGEVGMANTTPAAACIMAALKISDPAIAVGRGGGLTDEAFEAKKRVVAQALRKHNPDPSNPLDILSKVGGLDIAGMTGIFLGAAYHKLPVVIDGVIAVAGALLAASFAPDAKAYMIPSHISQEPGYLVAARHMGLTPFLNLGMRLGEGTGCPIMMQIVDDALAVMNAMNTFDGVSLESEYRKAIRA
jgi:nicotinate-nucleotide--dimethylbenzimidazole phosphoribosyltransferase